MRRPIEYYLAKILPVTESGCWLWTGTVNPRGYGRIKLDGGSIAAHRFIYAHMRREIPEGRQLDHLCRVRCCVNPDHLEVVDQRTNVLRGIGLTAQNARKTHCKRGHLLGQDTDTRGQRRCRICRAALEAKDIEKTRLRNRLAQRARRVRQALAPVADAPKEMT